MSNLCSVHGLPFDKDGCCPRMDCGRWDIAYCTTLYTPLRQTPEPNERANARKLRIEQLRDILIDCVRAVQPGAPRWIGMEFGKAIVGSSTLSALESEGLDRREEMALAIKKAKAA